MRIPSLHCAWAGERSHACPRTHVYHKQLHGGFIHEISHLPQKAQEARTNRQQLCLVMGLQTLFASFAFSFSGKVCDREHEHQKPHSGGPSTLQRAQGSHLSVCLLRREGLPTPSLTQQIFVELFNARPGLAP